MTYDTERSAIETYFTTGWSTAIGYDGQPFTPTYNSVRLTIQRGIVLRRSTGRLLNRTEYNGLIQFQVYTDGKLGTSAALGYVESIQDKFFEKVIDNAGVEATSGNAFIRFSPLGQHPYVAGSGKTGDFTVTTVNVPFVRYEYK